MGGGGSGGNRLAAINSPFETKDKLKGRGY
jgi:hypothetical protein